MKDFRTYEQIVLSACGVALGIELTVFATWYLLKLSTQPDEIVRLALFVSIPIGVIVFLVLLKLARSKTDKDRATVVTISQVNSFKDYLKTTRMWIILLGVLVIMPVLLFLTAWLAPYFPERGISRRGSLRSMIILALGIGPILILIGIGGIAHAAFRMYFHRQSS